MKLKDFIIEFSKEYRVANINDEEDVGGVYVEQLSSDCFLVSRGDVYEQSSD